ncbi:hypothetical protein KTS45_16390 [Halomicroarcula limicola]|uniref:Uncharacterized protein n=1 Tax=Haloarcula limicola TaxID=1429915 RepID=A0A8J7Y6V0_9EURY|nr:hypothetical protein [Halomicroarcula limicola]MBV0925785.1 hypothetical protein [Halomicroarcula limicola]
MSDCDNCESEAVHVWRHRRPAETMTHRTDEWLCATCHPEMPSVLRHESAR